MMLCCFASLTVASMLLKADTPFAPVLSALNCEVRLSMSLTREERFWSWLNLSASVSEESFEMALASVSMSESLFMWMAKTSLSFVALLRLLA